MFSKAVRSRLINGGWGMGPVWSCRSNITRDLYFGVTLTVCILIGGLLSSCLMARGITEVNYNPYPMIYEDDSSQKFGDKDDTVLIEVRRAQTSTPIDSLAIHYRALFPGGEIVKPGDIEEYVKIDERNAYRVTFRTKYIRRRNRVLGTVRTKDLPEGWTVQTMSDPETGKPIQVLLGPVVQRFTRLYLVKGDVYIYYVFLRADGDAGPARKKFEEFLRKGISYK